MTRFRLVGLPYEPFRALFDLSAGALARRHAVRMTVDSHPGFPCRVSLQDACVGEDVLLLPYEHLAEASPYRSVGPIFVRREAVRRMPEPGEIPDAVSRRRMSLRAYDAAHRMIAADLRDGDAVGEGIEQAFANRRVEYIHLHHALPGCFACRVERVD